MKEEKGKKEACTARSREVAQPSTDVARDCLISRFGVELDVSSRVWPLRRICLSLTLIHIFCKKKKKKLFILTSIKYLNFFFFFNIISNFLASFIPIRLYKHIQKVENTRQLRIYKDFARFKY